MRIELTKRWRITKTKTETKKLKEGDLIEYYFDENKLIDNPSIGEVKSDSKGLYISWSDSEDTRLDGSNHMKEVLDNCGWH